MASGGHFDYGMVTDMTTRRKATGRTWLRLLRLLWLGVWHDWSCIHRDSFGWLSYALGLWAPERKVRINSWHIGAKWWVFTGHRKRTDVLV